MTDREIVKNALEYYRDNARSWISGSETSHSIEALAALDRMGGEVEIYGLDSALMNAVKPSYDINIICPHCKKDAVVDNGEWLLWCGDKHHAEALLEAAKRYLAKTGRINGGRDEH